MEKDLIYWKNNAEEDYMKVPISVLRYITELEKVALPQANVSDLLGEWEKGYKEGWEAATTNAIEEIRKNYSPNCR